MNVLKEISGRAIRKPAYYLIAAAVIAAVGAFAVFQSVGSASAGVPRRPPSPGQAIQRLVQQREQYLRAHPLSSAQAQADRQKTAERIKALERQASSQAYTPLIPGLSQGTNGGPFPGCQFKLQSEYVSPPAGATQAQFIAYVGQRLNLGTCKPEAGAVYLFQASNASHQLQGLGIFDASTTTPLKIVSVSGNTLNLQALTGAKLTFNLATHNYAS